MLLLLAQLTVMHYFELRCIHDLFNHEHFDEAGTSLAIHLFFSVKLICKTLLQSKTRDSNHWYSQSTVFEAIWTGALLSKVCFNRRFRCAQATPHILNALFTLCDTRKGCV